MPRRKKLYNEGFSSFRFKDNPEERRFAEAWEDINRRSGIMGSRTLACLLATPEDRGTPLEPTQRERRIAATLIQWLGSPVGQFFLEGLGYVKKETEAKAAKRKTAKK